MYSRNNKVASHLTKLNDNIYNIQRDVIIIKWPLGFKDSIIQ